MQSRLTRALLQQATGELSARDPHLRYVVERFGPPPLWARPPGFATLLRIVLEQQVSLASAESLYRRLRRSAGEVTPETVGILGVAGLRALGFTRQKAGYCAALSEAVLTGRLDLRHVARMDEAAARQALLALRGIGPWSADIYLLMALRRPDVWPVGDLALAEAVRRLKGLSARPTTTELLVVSREWAPWRAVAARILWHFYLSMPTGEARRG